MQLLVQKLSEREGTARQEASLVLLQAADLIQSCPVRKRDI
jgi:hypothetical protein